MTNAALRGKPDAGNLHVRFDEGKAASENPRRGSRLYKKVVLTGLLAALALAGCKTSETNETAEAPAPKVEERVDYFPLVPKVEWEKLNWLQKTTASIAIVPGCILSACANAYVWAVYK